jgi:hypothetical protein
MKKAKGALLALMVAGMLGAGTASASAAVIEAPSRADSCPDPDSHWMDPGAGIVEEDSCGSYGGTPSG